jgi:prepilin-type N-terminal cleavage/methylation domain-containing protein
MITPTPAGGRRKAAFTLVELLIVVAIIGVLAGMLVPTVMTAMDNARQVECMNNLKQIATSVINYTTDYRGGIPPTYIEDTELYWCNLLAKRDLPAANTAEMAEDERAGKQSVFLCPATTTNRVKQGDTIPTPDHENAQGWYRLGNNEYATDCSYYWNGYVGTNTENRERFPSLSVNYSNPRDISIHDISEIAQRSATAMVMDGVFFHEDDVGEPTRIAARHRGTAGKRRKTNIAFYDTHVEALDRDPRTETDEIDWDQESNVGENLDLIPIMVRDPELSDGPPWFMLPKR